MLLYQGLHIQQHADDKHNLLGVAWRSVILNDA
jgi:hypothetical protein